MIGLATGQTAVMRLTLSRVQKLTTYLWIVYLKKY